MPHIQISTLFWDTYRKNMPLIMSGNDTAINEHSPQKMKDIFSFAMPHLPQMNMMDHIQKPWTNPVYMIH
jgi:hypothetical protein